MNLYHTSLLVRSTVLNSPRLPRNMQTSITSFFKVKPPKETVDNVESDQEVDGRRSTDTDIKEVEVKVLSTPSLKRAIDNDDEGDIMTTRSKKRATLSSAESTPVKMAPAEADSCTEIAKKVDKDFVRTPLPAAKQLFAPSPLMDVPALISAKISSGSSALHANIGVTWFKALQPEFDKPYFKDLSKFLKEQRATKTVYPPADKVYSWTHHHNIKDTRVVILGQDPYHGPNQAHGLSFSVQKGIKIPMSLQNIFMELKSDIPGYNPPAYGDLTGWAKQGVLLLNSCLTVNAGAANSHQGKGWEKLTDAVISWISKNVKHKVVFLLWGKFAQKKSNLIEKRHKMLMSSHPSPLSAHNGFMGCKHFSQTNAFLKSQSLPEIDWAAL